MATKTSAKKSAPTKDPKGGLTAAGRAAFAKRDGSHLKPGVKKAAADMTPEDMKRKGSWATRFYGRDGALPPLVGEDGKPTRFALTAAAWGEPVPKTEAAARRIAAKGHALLERYRAAKATPAKATKARPAKRTAAKKAGASNRATTTSTAKKTAAKKTSAMPRRARATTS